MKETVVKKHKVMQFIRGWDFHVVCVFAILSSKYWKWIIWCNSYWLQLWLQGHFLHNILREVLLAFVSEIFHTSLHWSVLLANAFQERNFFTIFCSMQLNQHEVKHNNYFSSSLLRQRLNVFSKVHSYIFVLFYSSLFWKKLNPICSAFQLK